MLYSQECASCLYDMTGSPVYWKEFIINAEVPNYVFNEENISIVQGEGNYTYVCTMRNFSGLYLVSEIPQNILYAPMYQLVILFVALLIIIVLGGVLAAVSVAKRQYRPIRQLREIVLEKAEDKCGGEISLIVDGVRRIASTHEESLMLQKNHCLNRLIYGRFQSMEEIGQKLALCKIVFPFPFYCCIHVQTQSHNIFSCKLIEEMVLPIVLEGKLEVYPVELIKNNELGILLNLAENMEDLVEIYVEELSEVIRQRGFSVAIGVGTLVPEMLYIQRSYQQSRIAAGQNVFLNGVTIRHFHNNASQAESYPAGEILLLQQLIKDGESEKSIQCFEEMIVNLTDRTPMFSYCVCFEVIISIMQIIEEQKLDSTYIDRLQQLVTTPLSELYQKLVTLIREVTGLIVKKQESSELYRVHTIVQFIKENFRSDQMGIDYIISNLNVSVYYLNRYFKEYTGCTVGEYIIKLRIREAKQLLVSTNTPVKDIVKEIGYIDESQFNRKFKSLEGVTPGQYRKMHIAE